MLKLKAVLKSLAVPQSALAGYCNLSSATIAQIVNHGKWPKKNEQVLRVKIVEFLRLNGVSDTRNIFEEVEPQCANTTVPDHKSNQSSEDTDMLLRKQTLTPAAKKNFGIIVNPFADLQSADDMWISPDIRYVRESMFHTAKHGGFLAVVGESGSGKTSVYQDLEARIDAEKLPIMLVKPYVLAAEDNDKKGKTLKSTHIAESLLRAVEPLAPIKSSPEARFAQLHKALIASHQSGYRICLVIEEAHSLPIPTLKHLKRILELQQGFTKLVSIILIGQPELLIKLSERNAEVREVVQRCEVATLNPIEPNRLADFLEFRLKRANLKLADVIDNTGVHALTERLVASNGNSQLYPLAVGNFLISAMNIAAKVGIPMINSDIIREVV